MSSPERPSSPLPTGFVDQPVDAQRYLGALRRDIWLIATIVIVTTVAVFAISLALPKTYRASVDIVYNPTATLQSNEATSTQRQLATFEALVQTPPVTTAAAHKLGESPKAVKDAISASANPNANLLTVTASARKGSVAAARANAVAQAFLSEEQSTQNLGLNNARAQLQAQIAQLRGTPGATKLIAALEERINALQINAAGTASELQIAESAAPPSGASFSPTDTQCTRSALCVAADQRPYRPWTRSTPAKVHDAARVRPDPEPSRPGGCSLPSTLYLECAPPARAVWTRVRDL